VSLRGALLGRDRPITLGLPGFNAYFWNSLSGRSGTIRSLGQRLIDIAPCGYFESVPNLLTICVDLPVGSRLGFRYGFS